MEPRSTDVCIWAAWIESEGKEELVREDTGVEQRKLTIRYINIYGTFRCITCIFFALVHVMFKEELYDLAL